MTPRRLRGAVLLLSLAACARPTPAVNGPLIAEGGGVTLTAGDLQVRLAEQPPAVRRAFRTPEGRRQFVEEALRFELLAQAAQKSGLGDDPDVQFALKKALVAAYYKRFVQQQASKAVPEAELQRYYDEHRDEFTRPGRARAVVFFLAAPEGSPGRAAAAATAQRLLAEVRVKEAKNPRALSELASERSDDAATRPLGGELGMLTREELELYDPKVADAALSLDGDQTWPQVIETARGFYLLRVLERQPEQRRSLQDARGAIGLQLARERQDADYRAEIERLRSQASLRIDEGELGKLDVPMVPGGGG